MHQWAGLGRENVREIVVHAVESVSKALLDSKASNTLEPALKSP